MTEKPRFSITLDDELFDRLEKYRYEKRFSTRSKAAAHLIAVALDTMNESDQEPALSQDERGLLTKVRKLNEEGKRLVSGYADSMAGMGYIKSDSAGMVEGTA